MTVPLRAALYLRVSTARHVIYGVDFLNKKPKGETIGAL